MTPHNDLDSATGQRERKAYTTLAAQFALKGMELVKGDWEVRGQALYYATRHNLWQPLESLDAAREYLARASLAKRYGEELQAQ